MSRRTQLARCARQARAYADNHGRPYADMGDDWRAFVAHYAAPALALAIAFVSLAGATASWGAMG